jgi:putative hemolysin
VDNLFEVVIILVLIVANGFFAASEIAVVSARKGRLEQQADEGRRGAQAALELSEHPNRFLSTVQVGITLVSTFAATFGGASLAGALAEWIALNPTLAPYASTIALTAVTLAIAYFSLIVGELVPKRLALQNAEGMAALVAPVMQGLSRLAAPVVWFLTVSTELVLRLLGRHNAPEMPVTEDDIMALVREGTEGGTVEAAEHELIANIFTFTDRTVRSMMTPRTHITALDVQTPHTQVLEQVIDSGYSRIPIYDGTLDTIVGILYAKDLLRICQHSEPPALGSLLRPALYIPESQRAALAFQHLKQNRHALALVLDEYGQVAGLLTLEDMLEELVGEIDDEYDEAREAMVRRADGTYLTDGLLPVADLLATLPIPDVAAFVRSQGIETVAGLVLGLLGHVPQPGQHTTWHGYRFEVVDMDGRRIDKVLITPPHMSSTEQTEGALASGAVLHVPRLPASDSDDTPPNK